MIIKKTSHFRYLHACHSNVVTMTTRYQERVCVLEDNRYLYAH